MSRPPMRQRYTSEVVLEWYDGPLRSIRRVDFVGENPGESLVEIRTCMSWHDGVCEQTDEHPRTDYYMRLSREELVQMLNLLDGKPVVNYRDDQYIPIIVDDVE